MTKALPTGCDVLFVGGTAWYLWNFRRNVIRALVDRGRSVVAVAPADESVARLESLPGVRFVEWPVDLDGSNPAQEALSLAGLARIVRRARPRFVLNHGIKCNIYGGLVCRLLGIPYANSVSGLGMKVRDRSAGARALSRLYAFACNGAETIFVQNVDDLALLRREGLAERVPVVRTEGSGVDLEHFAPAPMPPAPPRVFAFVGRLQLDKGIHEFVAAARRLRDENPATRFLVLGSRRHANRTAVPEAILAEWSADGVVELRGHCEDVRGPLAEAHALVLPSHGGEGVPRVILEAAALGRPAVVTDVPGCREAVTHGETGLICPARDAAALLDAMRSVADLPLDRLVRMGNAARRAAEDRFSERLVIEATVRVVEEALDWRERRRD